MLSKRGQCNADSQDIAWRFAPGGNNRYHKDSNPTGVVPLGLAENSLVHKEIHDFIKEKVDIQELALTYRFSTKGGEALPEAVAVHLNEYFAPHVPVRADTIITSSGLTAMHSLLAQSLADPGDGILVSRPIYGRFELDFGNVAEVNVVYADQNGVDPFEPGIIACYERALKKAADNGVNVRALMLVNPNNPLGRCYPQETLKEIMRFCESHKLHLISDEVYALSVFNQDDPNLPNFTSVLSFDPKDLIDINRLHVIYGFSKDFAAAGLRLGSLITQNSQLRKSISANIRFHNPSGLSVAAGLAILEDRAFVKSFLDINHRKLREAHKYTLQVLDEHGIEYVRGNAGLFVYVDLSPWLRKPSPDDASGKEPEFELAQKLLDGGVGLHPCEEHHEKHGQFRLVFSQEPHILEVGLNRLVSILRGIGRNQLTKLEARA